MSDQSLDSLLKDIENELLDHIENNLDANKLSVEQAKLLAKEFLDILPPHDKHDLLEKLKVLSQKHPNEVMDIYIKYAKPEYENDRDARLHLMAHHIKQGEIDKALEISKKPI